MNIDITSNNDEMADRLIKEVARLRTERNGWRDAYEDVKRDAEKARADAARYRWLRPRFRLCSPHADGQHAWYPTGEVGRIRGPNLDAAIDAALAGEKRNGL